MMKYRLIKEYPGSPRLGYIITADRGYYDNFKVEKYPDYWEKIVNYEVLATEFCSVVHDYCPVKILRLNDYQEFKIGDTIRCTNKDSHLHTPQTIESFSINDEGNCIVHTNLTNNNGLNLDKIEHCKTEFITEDGYKVKVGDKVYQVDYERMKIVNSDYEVFTYFDTTTFSLYKYFKYLDNAEQYIALHKKQFSLNDLQEFINKNNGK